MGLMIHLDLGAFKEVSGGASQVMIYGFGHCKYLQLIYTLQNATPPIVDKVFECSIGNDYDFPGYKLEDQYRTTTEKRLITQFKAEPLDKLATEKERNEKFCTRVCKMGSVNLIFENFLREKQGLPFIPFIMAVDVTDNKFPYNPADFASLAPEKNSLVTHSELRRCYKLAMEFPDKRIRRIAAETFHFVTVVIKDDIHYLKIKEPFWFDPRWKKAWKERKEQVESASHHKLFKEFPWRDQLLSAIEKVDKEEATRQKDDRSQTSQNQTFFPEGKCIHAQAGKDIYYPGEEGVEKYKAELRHRVANLKSMSIEECARVLLGAKYSPEDQELYQEQRTKWIDFFEKELISYDDPNCVANFKKEQISKIQNYIEAPCIPQVLYLLKNGYTPVSSNAYGKLDVKGTSFWNADRYVTPDGIVHGDNTRYFITLTGNENLEPNKIYLGVPAPEGGGNEYAKGYERPELLAEDALKSQHIFLDFENLPQIPPEYSCSPVKKKTEMLRCLVSQFDEWSSQEVVKQSPV